VLLRALIGLGVVAAIGIGVWLVFDEDGDQTVPEQLGDLFEPECEKDGGIYSGIFPMSPRGIGGLDDYHGRAFKTVIENRALEASAMGCEAAGGGIVYYGLTSHRAAERAAEVYRGRPVCLLHKGLFDDDFVDDPEDQLVRFCDELDGEVFP
jgi:hypothetical protein